LSNKTNVKKVRGMAKRAAIILSGGSSKRFQSAQEAWQDKALVELLGKPLLVRTIENVSEVVDEVVICVNNEKRKTEYSKILKNHNIDHVRLIIDDKSNQLAGPIVGILTGLKTVNAEYCFTIPSDMPLVQPKIVDYMFNSINDARIVVPMWSNGRLETLTMVLKKNEALEIVKTLCQLKRPRSDDIIRGALNVLFISINGEISAFDPKLTSFTNINSKTDLARLQPRQTQGPIAESSQLTLGNLPLAKLSSIQKASTLSNKGNFLEASQIFSASAVQLETEASWFWAAISRENEGKSLLNLSKQQSNQESATKYALKAKDAFLEAANNYELEAKIYEKSNATFLAERARSNKKWCEEQISSLSG
jgi:molybdopterin-guanine dinucleotide biosynthesis protein A